MTHVISSCRPLRHDVIAKTVYNKILQKENPDKKKLINNETEFITTVNDKEMWWKGPVKMSSRVLHNSPHMIVWDITKKSCFKLNLVAQQILALLLIKNMQIL